MQSRTVDEISLWSQIKKSVTKSKSNIADQRFDDIATFDRNAKALNTLNIVWIDGVDLFGPSVD